MKSRLPVSKSQNSGNAHSPESAAASRHSRLRPSLSESVAKRGTQAPITATEIMAQYGRVELGSPNCFVP